STCNEGWHDEGGCCADRIDCNGVVVDRDDYRLSCVAAYCRAYWPQTHVGGVLRGHGVIDCAGVRLGLLFGEWACAVYRVAGGAGFLRRQFRVVQPVVAGAVRNSRACYGVCFLYIDRTFFWGDREFWNRRNGAAHEDARRAYCSDCYCVCDRAGGHSFCSRNEGAGFTDVR